MDKKKLLIPFALIIPVLAFSQDANTIDTGNTAWVLISTALVMFMTVPALGLFYGGLVKRKNVLNILMQSFISLALISILWVVVGYSLAFSKTSLLGGFIGDFKWMFLTGVGSLPSDVYAVTIPHSTFMIYQAMFAVITPALIIGAFAERMKFSSFLAFITAWFFLVYVPVTHWVWSVDGFLAKLGAVDFAGGIVVHVTAGIASLVVAIMIGKRSNLRPTPPHNLTYTMIGAAMLWFGWFGFNAGSALGANGLASNAFIVTNTSASMATLVWLALDWIFNKKPTMLGSATGAIAGLASITPAAGFVGIGGAMIIGAISSLVCYYMVVIVKNKLGYDDALDAFGVHGVGGIIGSIGVGIFANPSIQSGYKGLIYGDVKLLLNQFIAVGIVILYTLLVTVIIYKVIDLLLGVRVDVKTEAIGLDMTQHNERGYTVIE